MAKFCSRCGKELSLHDSFEWVGKPVCEACLHLLNPGLADQRRKSMPVGQVLFSFEGRLCREDYWLKGFLVLLPFNIWVSILYYVIDHDVARILGMLISIASIWPGLALVVKRLHDRNRSGWFAALMLIPFAGIIFAVWIIVEVWFLRGTIGPNRFGDDPLQESTNSAPFLPETVNCPSCREALDLDPEERKQRRFTCPVCHENVSL